MKVPLHIVKARREKLAAWLQQRSYVPLTEVCARFKISEATARRDLAVLASDNQIRRTHGAALAEYGHRFPSFLERQRVASEGKHLLAREAYKLIEPEMTCYLDAGTTVFALAEELQRVPITPITVITHCLPTAELLAPVTGISVHLLGGELLPSQSILLGRAARMSMEFYNVDIAFIGAEGVDEKGLWNSQEEVVAVQKRILSEARAVVACVDATKLGRTAHVFLAHWKQIDKVVSDAPRESAEAAGIPSAVLAAPPLQE